MFDFLGGPWGTLIAFLGFSIYRYFAGRSEKVKKSGDALADAWKYVEAVFRSDPKYSKIADAIDRATEKEKLALTVWQQFRATDGLSPPTPAQLLAAKERLARLSKVAKYEGSK